MHPSQSRRPPRLIGRRLEFTHGFEYDGTSLVVRCYQPMLIVTSKGIAAWTVPAAACVVDADGYVKPKP